MNPLKNKIKEHPNLNQYQIGETLGEGTYGKVKLATHKLTNETVAIKFVEKSKLIRINDTNRIKTEIKIISELNHPNILKPIEVFEDEEFFYIVMERPIKGDLFNYISSKRRLSLKEATFMFYQIVNSLSFMHKCGVTHRDLKPENIMLSEDMIIKLGDFGLSSYYTEGVKLKTTCGSPMYSSPEMLRGRKYDPIPVDIWGLGIILYVMICGLLPFEDQREDKLFGKISRCEVNYPYFCNQNCKALIKRILVYDPKKRMTLDEIKASNVYITGRANFIKEFKIYDDDGTVLPQVNKYLRDLSLKSLEECTIELNHSSDKTPAYKIFYYKYLHKTDWHNYHIPIASLNNRALFIKDNQKATKNKRKGKESQDNKCNKRNICLLTIRDKSSLLNYLETHNNYYQLKTENNKPASMIKILTTEIECNQYLLTTTSHNIKQHKVLSSRASSKSQKKKKKNNSFESNSSLRVSPIKELPFDGIYTFTQEDNEHKCYPSQQKKNNSMEKIKPPFKV